MKIFILTLTFCIASSAMLYGQKRQYPVETRKVKVTTLKDVEAMKLNFCDTFSIEVTGLYPVVNELMPLFQDSTQVKTLLIKDGFTQTDWSGGNWVNGPRIIHLTYTKGDCTCKTFKTYHNYKKQKDGTYSLRIKEGIECNNQLSVQTSH